MNKEDNIFFIHFYHHSRMKSSTQFQPNLTPRQVIQAGAFGGTYWRPIQSGVCKKKLKNIHTSYKSFRGIPDSKLTCSVYDTSKNKYGVQVGTTLEFWESKKWIRAQDPYGWFQWYTEYYEGRRSEDDARQIDRWMKLAGPKGRFRNMLCRLIRQADTTFDDDTISPKIRQVLLHWGYELTQNDYKRYVSSQRGGGIQKSKKTRKQRSKPITKKTYRPQKPTDPTLYNKVKEQVYSDIPQHSAYRSGILVQRYKDAFKQKYGSSSKKQPYFGSRNSKRGLRRWFREKWTNQKGTIGYQSKSDVYRPSIRVNDGTPTTWGELSTDEIARRRREKARTGHVKRFHPTI